MYRFWLIVAQAVTVSLAILFVAALCVDAWPLSWPWRAIPVGSTRGFSFATAVARAAPAVVNVYTAKHVDTRHVPWPDDPILRELLGQLPRRDRQHESTSLGSGVIVADRYVLTNYHVVEAANAIKVALADGRESSAQVVGADPETDLAVLRLPIQAGKLPTAVLGKDDSLKVGDIVLAIGNPFGVGQTTTQGIVSALGRNSLGLNTYENFIQTDAAINPGNSGGALIDQSGQVVGINTAIYSQSGGSLGIGFSVPIDTARLILQEIVQTGRVQRGWLGVEPQDLTFELAHAFKLPKVRGVIIAGVMPDGPAAQSGLRVGDIVLKIDDKEVLNTASLLARVAWLRPGQSAVLGVLREGYMLTLSVNIGVRPVKGG